MEDTEELFEFDCPQSGSLERSLVTHEQIASWFMVSHLLHEQQQQQPATAIENEDAQVAKVTVQIVQFGRKKKSPQCQEEKDCRKHCEVSDKLKSVKRKGKSKEDKPGGNKTPKIESFEDDKREMLKLLRKHNERFTPSSLYEPSRHSVREVRHWEKLTGKIWSGLSPEERVIANEEILRMKLSNQ